MNNPNISTVVIVPCYNEASRLPKEVFNKYIEDNPKGLWFLFVNDGSNDKTREVLEKMCNGNERFLTLNFKENKGKAEAVRQGMLYASKLDFEYIGFLDADLAAPIEEIHTLQSYIYKLPKPLYIFGARVKLLGSTKIKRSIKRHYFGRIFATIVSNMLKLAVYDTQCGAKLIKKELIPIVFDKPFISKWLFDVEILFRIKNNVKNHENKIIEAPLSNWVEKGGSKISPFYVLKIPFDLLKIFYHYK